MTNALRVCYAIDLVLRSMKGSIAPAIRRYDVFIVRSTVESLIVQINDAHHYIVLHYAKITSNALLLKLCELSTANAVRSRRNTRCFNAITHWEIHDARS